MAGIETWSTTAATNSDASPGGAPENMAPSGVNNTIRENMAQVKTFYETMEWRITAPLTIPGSAQAWGHVATYASATTFTTGSSNDTTGVYTAGRRVRIVASTPGTIYGTVTGSSGTNPTTVTVVFDSGSLSSEALTVAVGPAPTLTSVLSGPTIDINSDAFTVQNSDGDETQLSATADGAVNLYFNNALKIATVLAGVDVTGTLQMNAGPTIVSGGGSPEGIVTADTGSLYLRTNGASGTTLYVKITGDATNTGWETVASS